MRDPAFLCATRKIQRRPGVVGVGVLLESARIYNFKGKRWANLRQ